MTPGTQSETVDGTPPIRSDLMQLCAYCELHVETPCKHDQYEECPNYSGGTTDDERRH